RVGNTLEPRRSHYMSSLWSPAGATGRNQPQIALAKERQKQAKTVAVGCDRLPRGVHGKPGVCRGLPPVAGGPLPEKEGVDPEVKLSAERYFLLQSGHWSQPQPVHAWRTMAR